MERTNGAVELSADELRLLPVCAGLLRCENDIWQPVYVHRELCELLGETEENFARELAAPVPAFIHPEDADSFTLLLYKACISGGLFQVTARVCTAGGKYRWMEISLNVELHSGGQNLLCILFNDVNMRMERQQKLDLVYSELLGVMNNTPGGIVAFDTINNRKLIPVFVSQGMQKLLHGTEEELSAAYKCNPFECVHPADRARVLHDVEDTLRNLSNFQVSMRLKTIPGDYVRVSAIANIDVHENQRTLYMAILDISTDTEETHIQKQILNMFVRSQYENICLIDGKSGNYRILTSDNGEGSCPGDHGENFEKNISAMIRAYAAPEEQEALISQFRIRSILEELEEKEDLEYFCTAVNADHKRRYKRLWLSWLDKETRIIALVSSDVTEEHRRSEENRAALQSALCAAEQASTAKSAFLSRMSHDIRTPLNAIIGYIEMSKECAVSPAVQDYLAKAESSSKFLLSLINDILNMSRIESGKLVLKESCFLFAEFLNGISAVVSSQCLSGHLHFTCQADDNVHSAYFGDRLKLQQILLNLLGNAVKFTPDGGNISLTVKEITKHNPVLLSFCVADTGCGISADFMPHLFDPFAQEKRELDSEIKGTGLGLAICKSLVEMMGGSISVKSEPGAGSAFTVEIPLKISDITEAGTADEEVPQVSGGQMRDFGGSRILMAEDNFMNAEIARHVLEKANFRVDAVQDGREACRVFAESAEGTYQAILMDIRMPVMDGLTATRTIRAMERGDRNIPVIAMSANAFEEDIREAMNSGMDAYTIKPIDVQQLYATLCRFIP